jgi:hypothetical protein
MTSSAVVDGPPAAALIALSTTNDSSSLVHPSFGEPGSSFLYTPDGFDAPLRVTVPACNLRSAFAHRLWRAGVHLADLVACRAIDVRGRNVLELGAGVGLPGIVAALSGAAFVRPLRSASFETGRGTADRLDGL